VDARERLRQYLEQRRELGESEFVLDGLSLEDAMLALGAKTVPAAGSSATSSQGVDPAERRTAGDAAAGGDWRQALRAIGADNPSAPEKIGRYEMPTSGTTPGAKPAAAHENAEDGIVVGTPMTDVAAGALAHLDSIDAVARAVATCTLCSLHATAKQAVPGEGNPHAGFVCVGEAPGATEDETGRPFVGAAGQLLTKILAAINLAREDVFICNVLKHRPPGNRNPAPDEIAACSPYLLRQLALLQPRVILALGTFAAQTLLRTTTPIGKLRGQVHRYYGVPLIVTYHPAALLRNPNWKRPTWEDVQLARRVFDRAASGA
jgi:DNA polymerase